MSKLDKILIAISTAMCSVLVLFELPNFIFTSAITDQEVSTLSKSIFIPLFIIGTVISVLLTHKKDNTKLAYIGLLFMGAFIILLAFLNVYNLQMLLPLLKTNSISLVIMWVARIMGGLVGLFSGFAFGAILSKGVLQYVAFVIAGILMFLLGLLAPNTITYEVLFYIVGFFTHITEVICVFSKTKIKEK